MATISLHYWAGARAAAGVASEEVVADSVAEALATARNRRADPHFERVLRASSVLIDGVAAHEDQLSQPVKGMVRVEILPPFAGGR
jgi:molybdopterin synthase sulfur carrier subunit